MAKVYKPGKIVEATHIGHFCKCKDKRVKRLVEDAFYGWYHEHIFLTCLIRPDQTIELISVSFVGDKTKRFARYRELVYLANKLDMDIAEDVGSTKNLKKHQNKFRRPLNVKRGRDWEKA